MKIVLCTAFLYEEMDMNMEYINEWDNVSNHEWTYVRKEQFVTRIVYRLTTLPNFTHQRFSYLCDETDQRVSAVGSKQLLMLRQLHLLGSKWTCSMRLLKTDHLELYFVFRCSSSEELSSQDIEQADAKIRNALPNNEYSFQ